MDPAPPAGLPVAAVYALLVASAGLGGAGDILIFQWARGQISWWLTAGIALWVASLLLMGVLFCYSTLPFSIVAVLLIVLHLVIDVVWDVGVVGTRLTPWQWAGVVLAGLATILLQLGARPTEGH